MAPLPSPPPYIVARTDSTLTVFRSDATQHPLPPETRLLSHLPEHSVKPSIALKWYPSGKLLAEGTSTGSILFRHHDGLHSIRCLDHPDKKLSPSPIVAIDVSTGSRYLATASADGLVSIWDMKSSSVLSTFRSPQPVLALSFQNTTDSRYLACATSHSISLYSRATERHVAHFSVSMTPHDTSSSSQRHSPSSPNPKLTALSFSPHQTNLLAATDDTGCLNVWDISRKLSTRSKTDPNLPADPTATYSRFTTPLRAPATDLSFTSSSGDASLCVAGFDKQLRIFDKTLKKLLFSVLCSAPISSLSFASDGERLALGFTNGSISIMKLNVPAATGEILSEIPDVHLSGDNPSGKNLSIAVRGVHFQPIMSSASKSLLNSKGKAYERFAANHTPFTKRTPANPRDEFPRNNGLNTKPTTDESETSYEARRVQLSKTVRSSDGPRDSDIFSPIVPKAGSGRHRFLEESSSDRQPPPMQDLSIGKKPAELERVLQSSHIAQKDDISSTWRTRPDTDQDVLFSGARGIMSSTLDNADTQPAVEDNDGDSWDADPADSDSVDSIVEKSAIISIEQSIYNTHSDVSHLQGSTVSEYTGGVGTERRDHTRKVTGEDVSSSSSDFGRRRFQSRKSPESQTTEAEPPKPPRCNTGEQYKSVAESVDQLTSSSTDVSPASMEELEEDNAKTNHRKDEENMEVSENRTLSEYAPAEEPASNFDQDGVRTNLSLRRREVVSRPPRLSSVGEEIRDIVAQEVDSIRTDLRSDILNIHTELVIAAAQHSKDLKIAMEERDSTVLRLEAEIRRLRADNQRLRSKYGLR